ncbi:malate dehydrogenase [Sulfolobus sp. A20]|uniref:NAD(P)-dependent malic enzyme n=1 Tax=Sulfolobaceae TaxID=118883 RepID=UPI000845D32D|nr:MULTISPECIES: NADP-dependent malic enzyme [unclassified Sulfolobus]TRM74906.1 NADP-dependent malic enzyme [Sulfolobus sp. A20-N-F8]TRM83362.1 NADP-dependent malic enzyme [Sulfolobus sp. F3]TRN00343.1 NADP-dependent malic enzyme [Sulfolobus sp. E1]AOL16660.1 malate dehydrogenase [Sulfolobus sp. A20]TRM96836.1 NADP-dependent malic enzyme [Sulfolobus sp. B1]
MPDPIELAKKYEGKIEIYPKIPITSYNDFALIYTPGVAEVSRAIYKDPDRSFELTSRWNTIAIVTDGTRVLGLGNIGPTAAMPVMEGKSLLFKYLGGVDAVPLPINVKNADDFVNVVEAIEPSFGGINLEDIESPKCFYILEKLQSVLNIPVWHDDQQGTAGATLAGLINALILTNRDPKESKIVLYGAGASNIATARILAKYGFKYENMIMIDSKGPLYPTREDIDHLMLYHKWKYELAIKTNKWEAKEIKDAFKGADIVVSASTPGPNVIKKEWINLMNKDAIVFALANPVPEILPQDAKEAGARIIATGRSDFPNQVNNSLVFPAIFRGVLDSRAKAITDEMIITASETIAKFARDKGINDNYIIPRMDEWEVYYEVAAAVASKAVELGLARVKRTRDEFKEIAKHRILRARKIMNLVINTWSP